MFEKKKEGKKSLKNGVTVYIYICTNGGVSTRASLLTSLLKKVVLYGINDGLASGHSCLPFGGLFFEKKTDASLTISLEGLLEMTV